MFFRKTANTLNVLFMYVADDGRGRLVHFGSVTPIKNLNLLRPLGLKS